MGKASQKQVNPALLIGLVAVVVVGVAVGAYFLVAGGEEEIPQFVASPVPRPPPKQENLAEEEEEAVDEEAPGWLAPEKEEEEEEAPTVTRGRTGERKFGRGIGEERDDEETEEEARTPHAIDVGEELE